MVEVTQCNAIRTQQLLNRGVRPAPTAAVTWVRSGRGGEWRRGKGAYKGDMTCHTSYEGLHAFARIQISSREVFIPWLLFTSKMKVRKNKRLTP